MSLGPKITLSLSWADAGAHSTGLMDQAVHRSKTVHMVERKTILFYHRRHGVRRDTRSSQKSTKNKIKISFLGHNILRFEIDCVVVDICVVVCICFGQPNVYARALHRVPPVVQIFLFGVIIMLWQLIRYILIRHINGEIACILRWEMSNLVEQFHGTFICKCQ